jgi:hypothetical protein
MKISETLAYICFYICVCGATISYLLGYYINVLRHQAGMDWFCAEWIFMFLIFVIGLSLMQDSYAPNQTSV